MQLGLWGSCVAKINGAHAGEEHPHRAWEHWGRGGGLLGKVRDLVTSSPFACLHWAHVQAEFGLSLVILTWEFPVSDMSGLIKNC